jgi:hypothetical protein
MTNAIIKDSLIAQLDTLPYDLQLRILDFAKTLSPAGVKGESLLRFEGSIPNEDLNLMSQAIDEGCEQVDMSGW